MTARPVVERGRGRCIGPGIREQSLDRLLGVQWLVRILHSRLSPEPLGPRVTDFHTRYDHRTPTDAQVPTLLEQAGVAH